MEIKDVKYISLQEATKYCIYSQEYLSLRSRQGKLKAVKFGRNWVTKKEWLEEYLKSIGEENNNIKNKKTFSSPYRLSLTQKPISEVTTEFTRPTSYQFLIYIAVFVFVLVFWAIIANPFASQKSANNNSLTASVIQDVFNPTSDLFKQYIQWLDETINNELSNFSSYIKTKFAKKTETKEIATPIQPQEENKSTGEQTSPEPTKEGIIIVPSTSTNEETVNKIKESFSDEVQVEQKDNSWGIIKPIFKNPSEQNYIYIMVPISTSSQSTNSK